MDPSPGTCGERGRTAPAPRHRPTRISTPPARPAWATTSPPHSRGGFKWDPSASISPTSDLGIYHRVYGGLMRPNDSGELEPDLAHSMDVVDANTVSVELREGLTLSAGNPLDAAMVKTILEGNPAKTGIPAFRPGFYSLSSVEATAPITLTLTTADGTAASWAELYLAGSRPCSRHPTPTPMRPLVPARSPAFRSWW